MLHGTGANGTDRALSAATAFFQELQAEYDKFRESSNQLEKELEEELSRTQKRARASEDEIWRAKEENRELKTRFTKQVRPLCVCVFSSHPFWTSSSLDVPAGVTQEKGHTGFLIHLPSAVRALIFVARRIQPFLSLVDREVEFCVLTN